MYRALTVLTAAVLGACAERPAPAIHYGGDSQTYALAEARAIEAAKHHPNAQPRVRPEYPEHTPPPLPAGQSLPAPLHLTRRSAPAPSTAVVERTVYDDSAYRSRPWYSYGYSYRQPWGGGWDPYGYGYGSYYYPRARYGYGYGIGLGISAPLWGSRYLGYPSYGRVHRLGWGAPHHHRHHQSGFRGGFGGFGGFRGGAGHVRSVSGRRR
ncbi:MAG TPA: hypothetical protein VMF89_32325 [Polyangiales bacterium]|nr:hypothetical protein [Polyangiales bacterium]